MKKTTIILSLCMFLVVALLAGCGGGDKKAADKPGDSGKKTFITIVTGGSSGPYYALGGTVAKLLNEKVPGVNASVQSTSASSVNATMLGNKKAEIAFAMNDVISYAYEGVELFKDKKISNLRGIAALYPNYVQVFTLKSKNINEIGDLKGKKVGVGAAGSGTEVNARQILAAHNITYNDIRADFLSYAEAVEQLKNGAIDAAFITSGLPNSNILDIATTHDVMIIPIRKDKVAELAKKYPFYTSESIPAGTYKNEKPVETAAVTSILVTRDDLSEDVVYNITKTILTNVDSLVKTHSAAKDIDLNKIRAGMPVPMHPGAEKYLKEIGK
jgi:TRAP transporter TAXI family solute receptor